MIVSRLFTPSYFNSLRSRIDPAVGPTTFTTMTGLDAIIALSLRGPLSTPAGVLCPSTSGNAAGWRDHGRTSSVGFARRPDRLRSTSCSGKSDLQPRKAPVDGVVDRGRRVDRLAVRPHPLVPTLASERVGPFQQRFTLVRRSSACCARMTVNRLKFSISAIGRRPYCVDRIG